jgi:cytochrome b
MVVSFAGAWLSAESERWRMVHVSLGYALGGLVLFRLAWGLIGSRHARFASFVRGPAALRAYLGSLLRGRPEHHTGHNPAGALAIVGLLTLGAFTVGSGWLNWNEIGGDWLESAHEAAATAMLALVGLHLAGVLLSSWMHRENLTRAMIDGHKRGRADEALAGSRRLVGIAVLLAVLGFWAWQASQSPAGSAVAGTSAGTSAPGEGAGAGANAGGRRGDRDDD